MVKNPPASAGDVTGGGLIPGSGRSPGGRNGNPLQYSCFENPMDRGAWRTTIHWVTNESDKTGQLNNNMLQLHIRHECFSYTKCSVCSDPHTSSLKSLELHDCCSRELECPSQLPYAPVSSDKPLVILQNPANVLYSVFETFSSSSKESGPSLLWASTALNVLIE